MWDALARLVAYPDANTIANVQSELPMLNEASCESAAVLTRFLDAAAGLPLSDLQAHYTALFDFDPACALDLGWHLFGEWRERGAFLAALREDLQRVGVLDSVELPDHLTNVLTLFSRGDPERAAALAATVSPVIAAIEQALETRGSLYVYVLQAIRQEMAALVERAAATR